MWKEFGLWNWAGLTCKLQGLLLSCLTALGKHSAALFSFLFFFPRKSVHVQVIKCVNTRPGPRQADSFLAVSPGSPGFFLGLFVTTNLC